MRGMRMTPQELAQVEGLLGRPPRGAVSIAVRDAAAGAAVVTVDPLAAGAPFPTTYWLVHRNLCKEIAKIESASFIKRLEREIAGDESLRRRLVESNVHYRSVRSRLMDSLHGPEALTGHYGQALNRVGIGGLKNFARVRCLHMHYAHFLTGGPNPVGAILEDRFGLSALLGT